METAGGNFQIISLILGDIPNWSAKGPKTEVLKGFLDHLIGGLQDRSKLDWLVQIF